MLPLPRPSLAGREYTSSYAISQKLGPLTFSYLGREEEFLQDSVTLQAFKIQIMPSADNVYGDKKGVTVHF